MGVEVEVGAGADEAEAEAEQSPGRRRGGVDEESLKLVLGLQTIVDRPVDYDPFGDTIADRCES